MTTAEAKKLVRSFSPDAKTFEEALESWKTFKLDWRKQKLKNARIMLKATNTRIANLEKEIPQSEEILALATPKKKGAKNDGKRNSRST